MKRCIAVEAALSSFSESGAGVRPIGRYVRFYAPLKFYADFKAQDYNVGLMAI